jgi:hypothetical protein
MLALSAPAIAATGDRPQDGPDLVIASWSLTDGLLDVTWEVAAERVGEVRSFRSEVRSYGRQVAEASHDPDTRHEVVDVRSVRDGESFAYVLTAELDSGEELQTAFVVTVGEEPGVEYEAISHSEDDVLELRWTLPPERGEAEVTGYEIELMMSSVPPGQEEISYHQTTEPVLLVPFPYGRSYGYFHVRALTADDPGRWSDRLNFFYEDVLPAPTNLSLHPRAGGFQVGWRYNAQAGEPRSWLVSLDGEPIDVQVTSYQDGRKALVLGLEPDSEHTITVQSVGDDGPGLPASATARTAAGPAVMAAPSVTAGPRGGPLSVLVSWATPDWGGGSPCCFRITASGRSASGAPVTVQRFATSNLRRLDFLVGAVGPWRFTIEAKTGAGFSPVSASSAKVRAA